MEEHATSREERSRRDEPEEQREAIPVDWPDAAVESAAQDEEVTPEGPSQARGGG